jgi:hypothetical protein
MKDTDNSKKQPTSALELLALGIELLDGKKGDRGEKGDKGDTGEKGADSTVPGPRGADGKDGVDGIDGKDGRDGKDGKDGEQGPKGDTGPQGPAGVNGKDGKDGESVTPELLMQVTMPVIVQNVQKAVASRTYSLSELDDVDLTQAPVLNGKYVIGAGTGSLADTYETINQNLSATDASFTYTGDKITSVTYGDIIKTIAYSGDTLVSITLSGNTPDGIDLVKTFTYDGSTVTGYVYS